MDYIVVPDGIAADDCGQPLSKPSFVYRQVLDFVTGLCGCTDTIYLAPANTCGDQKIEHEAGRAYLAQQSSARVVCPAVAFKEYIDTFGNAKHLRQYLSQQIRGMEFDLVCAYIHSYRAEYCFKKAGFAIRNVHRVYYTVTDENIYKRWWYYRHKKIHCLYELAAFIRDVCVYR
jgi:hypothetical protein